MEPERKQFTVRLTVKTYSNVNKSFANIIKFDTANNNNDKEKIATIIKQFCGLQLNVIINE